MLASLLAPHITGRYSLTFLPVALPEVYIRTLLPTDWAERDDLFLTIEELGADVPDAGEGRRWVCIEAGEQIDTGVGGLPGGKRTFFEAKLEVPFLRHPNRSATPLTFKHTMLFSSRMMALSSQHLTGLRSHRVAFDRSETLYDVAGFLSIQEDGDAPTAGEGWSEQAARRVLTCWWVGENTGGAATKFTMTSLAQPRPRPSLQLRLNLAAFAQLSPSNTQKVLSGSSIELDAEGWATFSVPGVAFDESTRMEAAALDSL
ncbi:hypothetical protein JCM10207_000679 [Rhodosporidiobolus poonsookiae]